MESKVADVVNEGRDRGERKLGRRRWMTGSDGVCEVFDGDGGG